MRKYRQLVQGSLPSYHMREVPAHVWHKRTPFNCGNKGCLVCSRPMRGKELRAYRYRRGEVEALDFDHEPWPSDPYYEDYCGRTLYEQFGLDEEDWLWSEECDRRRSFADYLSDLCDDGLSDDWMDERDPYHASMLGRTYRWQHVPHKLSDELWHEYEEQKGFWEWTGPWNHYCGPLDIHRGMVANLEAMLDPKADESMMYLEDEDAA